MIGLLNVNKSTGVTSRAIVDRVQRRLPRKNKVGHAGTLDPLASGVLVLCIGRATRLIPYVQQMRKSYRATFRLGCESETEDTEGEVVQRSGDPRPTRDAIESSFANFLGSIMQRPPKFSALKVGGRRAYSLARGGQEVELELRPIQVYSLNVVTFEYPELVMDIECGSGTYVRSLGRDIAESLGTAAVMSGLVRTGIGAFRLEESVSPSAFLDTDAIAQHLLPIEKGSSELPSVVINETEIARVRDGLSISDRFGLGQPKEVAAHDERGRLVAILVPGRGHDRKGWGPLRNFADLL